MKWSIFACVSVFFLCLNPVKCTANSSSIFRKFKQNLKYGFTYPSVTGQILHEAREKKVTSKGWQDLRRALQTVKQDIQKGVTRSFVRKTGLADHVKKKVVREVARYPVPWKEWIAEQTIREAAGQKPSALGVLAGPFVGDALGEKVIEQGVKDVNWYLRYGVPVHYRSRWPEWVQNFPLFRPKVEKRDKEHYKVTEPRPIIKSSVIRALLQPHIRRGVRHVMPYVVQELYGNKQ